MQDTPIEQKTLNILSLESLQKLHFKDLMAIHNIKRKAWIRNIVISLTLLCTVVLTIWALKRSQKKPLTTVILQTAKIPQVEKIKSKHLLQEQLKYHIFKSIEDG